MADAAAAAAKGKKTSWDQVAQPQSAHEDRMLKSDAQVVWNAIYKAFGATGEAAHREVKLAVYAYYANNGASPQTRHSLPITTGSGLEVPAAEVVKIIGIHRVRRFLRADVQEAYRALKESGVCDKDEVAAAKAQAKGLPAGSAFLTADFLRGCPLLTPEEQELADRAFAYSIRRARAGRGGLTVEQLEGNARDARIAANEERPVPVRGGESGRYTEF